MRRLLWLEVRRAVSRRLVKGLALLALIGILIAGISVFFNSEALTEAERQSKIEFRDRSFEMCMAGDLYPPGEPAALVRPNGPPIFVDAAPELGTRERAEFCQIHEEFAGRVEVGKAYDYATIPDAMLGLITPLAMVGLILGASLIGAEWRANTVAVQLTWESRRTRVMVAKAAVAGLVGIAFFLLVQAALALALLPAGVWRGSTVGLDADWWRSTIGLLLRGGAFVGMASVIGFSIAAVGRNTTAALGVMFGYFALLEGALLGGIWPWIRPWLLVGNSVVFVSGEKSFDVAGRDVTEAGVLLLIYTLVVLAAATAWVDRRDIS